MGGRKLAPRLADHDADFALSVAKIDEGGFDGPTFFANPGEEAVAGLALGFGDDPPPVVGQMAADAGFKDRPKRRIVDDIGAEDPAKGFTWQGPIAPIEVIELDGVSKWPSVPTGDLESIGRGIGHPDFGAVDGGGNSGTAAPAPQFQDPFVTNRQVCEEAVHPDGGSPRGGPERVEFIGRAIWVRQGFFEKRVRIDDVEPFAAATGDFGGGHADGDLALDIVEQGFA